ncbi:GIY-YIG nuclease family protein [Trueperella pyogenes]|uniref:GIY-YIG nuclease family protein n=1 Tax=Trueperella pyogenes TaxID=1661 RepID=UPI00345D1EF6
MSVWRSSDHFDRYEIARLSSISALISDNRRGIYVLEFEDGTFYVGQAQNVVTRFAQHRHGHTNHIAAWDDIVAIRFMHVPWENSLDEPERNEIERLKAEGKQLRNKTFNMGHAQPSPFDDMIPVVTQTSWVLGNGTYGTASFVKRINAAAALDEQSKLSERCPGDDLQLIMNDLATAVTEFIPEAVKLEGRYWTVSDMPSTSGGRWVTLNTGSIELLYIPRQPFDFDETGLLSEMCMTETRVNLAPGTLFENDVTDNSWWIANDDFYAFRVRYPSTQADQLVVPAGYLSETLTRNPDLIQGAREFALAAMRQNTSSKFARWHSRALASEMFAQALQK